MSMRELKIRAWPEGEVFRMNFDQKCFGGSLAVGATDKL